MTDKMDPEQVKRIAAEVSKRLADEGKLIKAGWVGYQMLVLPPDAGPVQVDECRIAFMAGAQHLFSSIMAILDPGTEPTEKDLRKMDLIHQELSDFTDQMQRRLTKDKP